MKKTNSFNKMSKVPCNMRGCGNMIKQNMVDRKARPETLTCFSCFRKTQAARGNDMTTAREVRNGARGRMVKIPKGVQA